MGLKRGGICEEWMVDVLWGGDLADASLLSDASYSLSRPMGGRGGARRWKPVVGARGGKGVCKDGGEGGGSR